jgi:glucose/arabinose dehydrogenase
MQSHPIPMKYQAKRSPARRVFIAILALAAGGIWLAQTLRRGAFTADPSGVGIVTNTRPADGERDVLPNAFVSVDLNSNEAIDPDSIDNSTVALYREPGHELVAARVNTSAAGDSVVLTPLEMLAPKTRYVFEIRGVKDLTGEDLLPFTMSFTTSGGASTQQYPAAFEKIDLPGDHEYYTALTTGPDQQLYAGTVDGKIIRRPILGDGSLGDPQVIKTVQESNRGPRLITGITFDPASRVEDLVLWVSHGQFIVNQRGEPSLVGASDWTGKISTVSGPALSEYRDVVVNLPRSWRDHLNNQLGFGPDGCIYFTQGSHTAMGAPDQKWGGNRVERLLSSAVLRLDRTKLNGTLNAKTTDGGGSYDPFAADAPLTVFASGVRVGYDMLWHSNGHLYTAVNGSAAGGNTPGTPSAHLYPKRLDDASRGAYAGPEVTALNNVAQTQPDLLLKLEKGGYYGHPNPLRGEYVLNGGNPTADVDPMEVLKYPPGTMPDRNWRTPAYNFGTSVSPNGMLEFKSRGLFGGALDSKVLITRFSGGKDIIVLALNDKGDVIETITGIAGLTNFTQPLDLTQDPLTGCIYVAEYGGERLTMLRPIVDSGKLADLRQNVFRQQVRASIAD